MVSFKLTAEMQQIDLRNSSRDVDDGVELVERREDGHVVLKEVLLNTDLCEREEDAEDRLVLEPEDVECMLLRKLSDFVRTLQSVQVLGNLLGHGVDDVVESPVEHLDQEGELLQNATVDVSSKPRSIERDPPDCLPLS